ncbi:putative PEP motif putative anchor domain-containing protein [Magnetofaba australis IT-1]|uniref:Putative PEP motif putative anchor domain-containing protein n=2 Tax=Magnetofaba TaxID=1472292 RepID=A0A1Y2K1F6_9PROT|nr:putative PEP motif putative anchor domain-containing protein [Magnetofaba australis IT-1]
MNQGFGRMGQGSSSFGGPGMGSRGGMMGQNMRGGQGGGLDANGNDATGMAGSNITFQSAPVPVKRGKAQSFRLPNGQTHWYEAVYTPQGGINWSQAKALAEQAGGYLVTLHSHQENDFVFGLIQDRKYWYGWDSSHNGVMNGPFIGAYQPQGAREPDGGWRWVSGEPWSYTNWAYDGMPGDKDPRPNTQPNDSTGNQNVAAFGEVNIPVATWGDFPHRFSSYRSPFDGKAYGFVIEYNAEPQ